MKFAGAIFLCFVMLLAGCSKYEPKPYYAMNGDFRSYIVFKPGSYWVYRDSALNITDTIKLLSSRIERKTYEGKFMYESLMQQKYSTLYKDTVTGFSSLESYNGSFYFLYFEGTDNRFFNNLFIGTMLDLGQKLTYEGFYDSLKIADRVYSQVKVFRSEDQKFNGKLTRAYYSRKVGVVQLESNRGMAWKLIRHKIVQ